ncbi:MAG TPA: hypothetical protein VIG24_12960 [Acidimicrobiia bacterium]
MNWYLGLAASAFCAGMGWYAASFLWAVIESFIIDDEEEDDPYDYRN